MNLYKPEQFTPEKSYEIARFWAEHLIEHGSTKTLAEMYEAETAELSEARIGWLLIHFRTAHDNIDKVTDLDAPEYRTWIHTLISDIEYDQARQEQNRIETYVPIQRAPKSVIRKSGYLYVLRAVLPETYYKIGLSKEPVARIYSLGVNLPFPIEPLHVFPTNDMFGCERYLHNKFTSKRVNGEWFQLEQADVDYLLALPKLDAEDCQ